MDDDQTHNSTPPVLETAPDRTVRYSRIPVTSQLVIIGGVLLLLLSGAIIPRIFSASDIASEDDRPLITTEQPETPQPFTESELTAAYDDLQIQGKAVYVWDMSTQQALYAKNESDPLPLASITKLMTALVGHELLPEGEAVTISAEAADQDSASGLPIGSIFTRESISKLMMIGSANDGAYALSATAGETLIPEDGASAFVAAMNVRADEMGLGGMEFRNASGLDISKSEAGGIGSARDVAFLMEHILNNAPHLLEPTKQPDITVYTADGVSIEASNTNYYIDEIPGLLGSKTGYTDLAGGNLVVAYNAGLDRPIIVVVLGSTQFERFTDVMKLIDRTNDLLRDDQETTS